MTSPISSKSYLSRFAPAATLLLGLGITFLAWNSAMKSNQRVQQEKFDFRANEIAGNIVTRLKSYEQVLLGASGLFAASRSVERDEYHNYAAKLQLGQNFPGIQGIGFSLLVPAREKQHHIEQIRREGFPDYNLRPDGERDIYTAIIYLEPFDWRNQRAFGFDMYSEPTRRAAMNMAWEEGKTALSGKVKLVQETSKDIQWGFLVYVPVYRNGVPVNSASERQASLVGWSYAPFRMNDFMQGILGKQYGEIQSTIDMEVFDGETLTQESRMYDSNPESDARSASGGLYTTRKIEFGNHVWTIAVRSLPGFEMQEAKDRLRVISYAGIIISMLMAFAAWLLLSRRERALAMAQNMASRFKESELRNSAIMENVLDGVITINERGIVESFNKAAENIFGYAATEVVGNNVKMLMPEPYHSEHDGYLHNYISTGNRKIIGIGRDVVGRRKDGSTFPMNLAVSEMWIESARMFIGVVRDITEQKHITGQLWLQGAALGAAANAIVIAQSDGTIEWINPAFTQVTGYSAEEAIGKKLSMLKSGQQNPEYYKKLWATICAGNVWHGELVNRRKDGSFYTEEQTITPLKDEQGKVSRFIAIKQDITERKEAEERLRSVTALRAAILDSANFSIISTDINGLIQTFNHGAERMLGYTAGEMVGKQTPAILHDRDEIVQRARELSVELGWAVEPGFDAFVAKARLGTPDERKWTYIRKDGSRFPVLLSITAILDAEGKPGSYLGIASDITESIKVERMKSEFVSTVSHELRTPLTSIRGALGLIAGGVAGELPEKAKSLVDIAHKNSERLILLVNDILDMEKIESGKISLNLQQVDLVHLVRQAMETNRAYGEQFKVEFVLEESPANCMVNGDIDRLMQVMANLLSNAAKFSPAGGAVTISVSSGGQIARVAVADHGPGIPEEFHNKIFQRFSQADASDTRQKSGTGLGLSITKALVEQMGGKIGYETKIGMGTIFYFELPECMGNVTQKEMLGGNAGKAQNQP